MSDEQLDRPVRKHIEALVHEEHKLWDQKQALSEAEHLRLKEIQVELDQCWDLLRQRRALREFGADPEEARIRPKEVVEKYEQ